MNIVFFCQSCGARFEVAPRMAGKKGRCTKCGQNMAIPDAPALASMTAMPAAAPAATPHKRAPLHQKSLAGRLRAVTTSIGLDPITIQNITTPRGFGAALAALDDAADSSPYLMATAPPVRSGEKTAGPANALHRAWYRETGSLQKLFRKINQFAYLLSVPCIGLLLLATALKNRPLALFAATLVVLLNLGRIISGIANLVMVPLRSGLNTKKLNKPFWRIVEPVITIGLVVLGFTFIPWLAPDKTDQSLPDRLRQSALNLKGEMKNEVGNAMQKARSVDVQQLESRLLEKAERIGIPSAAPDQTTPAPPAARQDPQAAVNSLINRVGSQVKETIRQAEDRP